MKHIRADYNRRIQDNENLIPDDEPVFLIRGQDVLGPMVLRYWASQNDQIGGDPDLSAKTKEHALKMAAWHTRKVADCPPEELETEAKVKDPSPSEALAIVEGLSMPIDRQDEG